MLRPKPQLNLQNAREYFRAHLCVGDYYSEGQTVTGEWLGAGAETLGLRGAVAEKEFLALCEGMNPATGERLTQRLNSVRIEDGRQMANRRIFHDFTISPPKSVSIVALCYDDRIVSEHRNAVRLAMIELERFAETRVRIAKQYGERVTGNLVAACFQHDTSRALDPHLHTHCVVFNATFDQVENRWKALQTVGMYRAQKFAENVYFHELAKGLRALGYELENNARNFEIKGVLRSALLRFSKRHEQIAAEARRYVANGYDGDVGALRTRLAHEHRERKMKNATAEVLRMRWRTEMNAEERRAFESVRAFSMEQRPVDVRAIVAWAHEHVFERKSVVNDYELLSTALARGRGENFDLAALRAALAERDYLREDGTSKLISRELYRCEFDLVMAAQDGRYAPLNPHYRPDPRLAGEQERAARQILSSREFLTLFRGGAGTGKTHTLKEIALGLAAAERPVLVLAPQGQQVHELAADGLPAHTLAHALTTRQLAPGAVVILDEAGQVGGKDLWDLVRLVRAHDGRLILSGDTRQHGAVAASDALRAIEKHGRGRVATLRTIRRQDPSLVRSVEEKRFIRQYRVAVKLAADGDPVRSLDLLDRMGCIREFPDGPRRAAIAGEYVTAVKRGEKPLVVAQTWNEVHAVNDAVRAALGDAGELRGGVELTTYQPIDRSEAQKRDARFYEVGQSAHFIKTYGRFRKGDTCEILGADERGVIVEKNGRRSTLSYRYADRFVVAEARRLEIAPGDRLQLKANGRGLEGTRLHNGELVTVTRVDRTGALVVTDERGTTKALAPSQRLLVRGYAVTSYASQGKTADIVLFADSGNTAATNARQWYVTISRGRKHVVVFTPDKERLRTSIEQSRERELAIDDGRFALGIAQREAMQQREQEREFMRQQQAAQMNARQGLGIHL